MILASCIIFILIVGTYLFFNQSKFGKISSGERLKKIQNSPNYRDGSFQNLNPTLNLTEGVSYARMMKEFFFNKSLRVRPKSILPSLKTDLQNLSPDKNCLVWFGHSSYFIQIDDKKILVDPIFSGNSSPVKFTTKSYPGSDIYTAEEMPEIDYLFITHDHWDHLDYETITKLRTKVKKVITGLGTGAHLEHWGYNPEIIIEKDWYEEVQLDEGFKAFTSPGRHFSGRGLKRNQVLWMSFLLETPSMKIFMGGDSGYDDHFKEIGKKHGQIDLAILECGQYNKNWKYIHMMPDEIIKAVKDLNARYLLPVHWAKYALAQHDWDEPITRVIEESIKNDVSFIHPMIGEAIDLNDLKPGEAWWKGF